MNGNTVTANECVGLYIKADLSKLTVTDLTLKGVLPDGSLAGEGGTGSFMGIGTYNGCYGVGDLQLTNVTIDGFSYGLYFGINPAGSTTDINSNPVSVTANNLTVQNCYIKGAYFEKLTDSSFTSCTFANNGTDPNMVASESMRTWMCGVDINLKIGDKSVTIKGKDGTTTEVECDNVVNAIGFVPTPVAKKGKNVHLVGDCIAIGNLRTVIWRAWDVCMKI